ncbi:hypothetical protein IQ07DRAFT_589371 [Pyrenochaeta sp. DS3sAY3a]|nr:hypothetical protein IQ07DRAFT_589371 [Pyrenochaeta sp. DS3sAY3a]
MVAHIRYTTVGFKHTVPQIATVTSCSQMPKARILTVISYFHVFEGRCIHLRRDNFLNPQASRYNNQDPSPCAVT